MFSSSTNNNNSCLSLLNENNNNYFKINNKKYSSPPPLRVHSPSPTTTNNNNNILNNNNIQQERRSPSLFDLRNEEFKDIEEIYNNKLINNNNNIISTKLSYSSIILNQQKEEEEQKQNNNNNYYYQKNNNLLNNKRLYFKQNKQQLINNNNNYLQEPTNINNNNFSSFYQSPLINYNNNQHKFSTCTNHLPLSNRYNKSCDWLAPFPCSKCSIDSYGHEDNNYNNNNSSYRFNPIAQVSSDILRAQGYSQQFKSLLSTPKSRRDSVPDETYNQTQRGVISQQQSLEEKCNGELSSCLIVSNNNNNNILPQQPLINNNTTKSLEWSPTIEETKKTNNLIDHQHLQQQKQQILRRRQSGYGISITTESQAKMRCKLRKLYFLKRNKICDLSLALAIIGLIFVVLDQELTAIQIFTKNSLPSLFLRSACVASTFLLIASLVNYHRTEVKIALIDSGAEDWRVAVTTDRIIKLSIEIFVCAICPFPGSGTITWPYISADEHSFTKVTVPLDVLLAVPMFLRSYLLCRFMVLHSRQFQDAATRSIAALNRISMDFRFVIKTMMADHPMTVLVIFTCCYWVCMSWMFTQCERYNGRESSTEYYYMNSLWFIMVTFMSIGYGDVVPTSYCGRLLSITTGIVGAGVSSALIAVISKKLELSRAEKHVNNFMADSKLTNARKNAAASVLQHTWFIHKYQQRNGHKGDEIRLRQHQRKFLNSINEFRRIKWDQRKLQERGNSLLDVGKLHTEMHETLWEMHRTQDQFVGMIEILTQRITELQQTVLNASNIQQNNNNHLFPQNRKISKNTQLLVPLNISNNRKVSSSNNNNNYSTQKSNIFLKQTKIHSSIDNNNNNKQKYLNNKSTSSNLELINSSSSPCLQKSQQQQTILQKMKVFKNEDECIPLMINNNNDNNLIV